jgi:hypothetical protein
VVATHPSVFAQQPVIGNAPVGNPVALNSGFSGDENVTEQVPSTPDVLPIVRLKARIGMGDRLASLLEVETATVFVQARRGQTAPYRLVRLPHGGLFYVRVGDWDENTVKLEVRYATRGEDPQGSPISTTGEIEID